MINYAGMALGVMTVMFISSCSFVGFYRYCFYISVSVDIL